MSLAQIAMIRHQRSDRSALTTQGHQTGKMKLSVQSDLGPCEQRLSGVGPEGSTCGDRTASSPIQVKSLQGSACGVLCWQSWDASADGDSKERCYLKAEISRPH